MSDTVLNFRKFRGKNIAEVYETDIGYAKWLYSQELLIGLKPTIKEFLQLKFHGTDMGYVMRWGKHSGKSIQCVKSNDSKYIDWLSKNEYVNGNCLKLKKSCLSCKLRITNTWHSISIYFLFFLDILLKAPLILCSPLFNGNG